LQGATTFLVTASLPKIVNLMPLRVKMKKAQQPKICPILLCKRQFKSCD
jgi:hypothetical protein